MTTSATTRQAPPTLGRGFRVFWGSSAVSLAGDALRGITVVLWLYAAWGGSARAVALGVLAERLPALVVGPGMGALADRYDRKQILIVSNAARAAGSGAILWGMLSGSVPLVLGALAASAIAGGAGTAARGAVLPRLVAKDALVRANSTMTTTEQVTYILGPLLGALLYGKSGPAVALTADAVSFVAAALLQRGLPSLPAAPRAVANGRGRDEATDGDGAATGVRAGIRALLNSRDRTLAVALGTYLCVVLQAGINNTVLVAFLPAALDRPEGDVALFSLTNGVAQVLVAGLLIGFAARLAPVSALSLSAWVMVCGGWVLAGSTSLYMALAGVLVIALAGAPLQISFTTLRQTRVPDALQGRATGLVSTLSGAAFLAASQGGAWLADHAGPRAGLVGSAGALTTGALLTLFLRHAGGRAA
ncbi:MFS transporter [Streptomyces roseoverticillatus]|uniref:MFS transporter n=1 Tax=Streptomyces roseoverticillatus TaxID=66429 RepID=UPI0033C267CA